MEERDLEVQDSRRRADCVPAELSLRFPLAAPTVRHHVFFPRPTSAICEQSEICQAVRGFPPFKRYLQSYRILQRGELWGAEEHILSFPDQR